MLKDLHDTGFCWIGRDSQCPGLGSNARERTPGLLHCVLSSAMGVPGQTPAPAVWLLRRHQARVLADDIPISVSTAPRDIA